TASQLTTVPVDEEINGFTYLGLDDYQDDLNAKRKPMRDFLPSSFDESKVTPVQRQNEKGRTVRSGKFPDLKAALQAFSASMKRRRALFLEDAQAAGYGAPSQEELVYWTYIYYNAGVEIGKGMKGGKGQLLKYKGKRKLGDWITKKEYPNAMKLLDSYRMIRELGVFK
ncbi:MAG TPA: hypothetical protein VNM90_02525, partial [Haliangium sp.]|nr:hypothetical protein [Haliangium sp.]